MRRCGGRRAAGDGRAAGLAAAIAAAQNDAGLVALAAGRYARPPSCSAGAGQGAGRSAGPPPGWPGPRRWPAPAGRTRRRPRCAGPRWSRSVRGDQPWALVPRMSRVQGLVALARGDLGEARRRLSEAADGWRRTGRPGAGEELMASLVDLGRPPVVGLVEPAGELRRVSAELAELDERRAVMPGFTLAAKPRARRGGLEAAVRPHPVPGVVGGRRDRAPTGRASTPVAARAIPTSRCRRSCAPTAARAGHDLLPGLRHRRVWQLAEAGTGTAIEVRVDLPDAEAHRLDGQREVIGESLGKLAALAEAAA